MRRTLDFAEFVVPVPDRERLGLTPGALEKTSPAPWAEVERMRPLLDARGPWIARCLPVYRLGEDREEEGRATVSFVMEPDGRAGGILVALDVPEGASERPADCVREAVAQWEIPRPAVGGRVWFVLVGNGPVEPLPESPAPKYLSPGFRPPREKVSGCVARELRLPSVLPGITTGQIAVKFAVRKDGRVANSG